MMLNDEWPIFAIFAAVAGYAPQMGDRRRTISSRDRLGSAGNIPQNTLLHRSCRFRNARRDRRARAASRRA